MTVKHFSLFPSLGCILLGSQCWILGLLSGHFLTMHCTSQQVNFPDGWVSSYGTSFGILTELLTATWQFGECNAVLDTDPKSGSLESYVALGVGQFAETRRNGCNKEEEGWLVNTPSVHHWWVTCGFWNLSTICNIESIGGCLNFLLGVLNMFHVHLEL